MSNTRRIISSTIDTENNVVGLVQSDAVRPFSPSMTASRATQIAFRATLVLSDSVTPFTIPTGTAFAFGINKVFNSAPGTGLVVSLTADFQNLTDWPDADVLTGKLCWRADLTTQNLKNALGSDSSATMYAVGTMADHHHKRGIRPYHGHGGTRSRRGIRHNRSGKRFLRPATW